MPIFPGSAPDEATQLLRFLAVQRQGLRAAVAGLSEEQARSTPTASSMSLAALLKHVTATERRWVVAAIGGRPEGIWPVEDWDAEWRLQDDDTVDHLLARYAALATETEAIVARVPDLGAPCPQPESAEWSVRWVLLHLLEELARHAGHADVIRESIDGATADRGGGAEPPSRSRDGRGPSRRRGGGRPGNRPRARRPSRRRRRRSRSTG
jgi:uncharacterized damage-inducible protein DinB